MAGWEPLDIGILLVAAYIAVVTLVRMMVRRRDKLLDDLSKGASQNQGRKRKPGDETKAA
ncbi:MAG TPA: hypothetical protein VGY55_13495 [Pirellulales bacterium]|jgi:hypothetical protein|nr:hypothetical protein [Pirellulales bacterium]